ncbi:hypothetical protein NKDENANG_03591 [Candidatus Entotheonellaceae bacterium PAL068K]
MTEDPLQHQARQKQDDQSRHDDEDHFGDIHTAYMQLLHQLGHRGHDDEDHFGDIHTASREMRIAD